jgi:hypothetical protein
MTSRFTAAASFTAFAVAAFGAINCLPPASPSSESSDEPLKGLSLDQLSARWHSMTRLQPPPPAFMSSIVLHHSGSTAEAYTSIARWCRANGGKENFDVHAGECPSYETPTSECFGEATWHYSDRHHQAAYSTGTCVKPDGTVSVAILGFDNAQVALYSGAELSAFVERYVEVGKAQVTSWKNTEEKRKQDDQAAFDQAVLALDASKEPGILALPTARESIDFLREKLKEGVGRTRLSEFANRLDPNVPATMPCQMTSQSEHQNPTILELRELDLNVVDTFTTLTMDRYLGHPNGDVVPVFQLKLATKTGIGFAEFYDADTAKRCAKAFVALARRCGAKQDNRFK